MLRGRSTRDEKFDYLDETDAEEKNVGSVIPFEQDAMGIRNDAGIVGGDANTPVFGEDDDADDETYDELVEDEETDLKNIGIGIPGNLEHSSTERAGSIDEAMDELQDFEVEDSAVLRSADDEDNNGEIEDDALEEDDDEDIDDENAGEGATFNAGYTSTVHDASSARIGDDEAEGIHVETRR
jgi:hypothetical protein